MASNYGDFVIVHNPFKKLVCQVEYEAMFLYDHTAEHNGCVRDYFIYIGVNAKDRHAVFAVRDNIYGIGGGITAAEGIREAMQDCENNKRNLELYKVKEGVRKRL